MISRYITLEELMKRFHADLLLHMALAPEFSRGMFTGAGFGVQDLGTGVFDAQSLASTTRFYKQCRDQCIEMSLGITAMAASRIIEAAVPGITIRELHELEGDFGRRLTDQLQSYILFSIDSDKHHFVTEQNLFGEVVPLNFPQTAFDIREAGRCLAFDRWQAAVFHSMRVLEIGLSALAKDLGVNSDKANWHEILVDIEKAIKAIGPTSQTDWQKQRQFYSETAVQFRYFKDAWRNHVMHVRDTYDEEHATQIFAHVKDFMRHLSTRLKENA